MDVRRRRSNRWLFLLAAVVYVGCADSPTAPSPVISNPPRLSNLRWDASVPGCSPQAPPSPLPDPDAAHLEPGPHGVLLATWPYQLATGRSVVLHARLIERGSELLVCEWDVADL